MRDYLRSIGRFPRNLKLFLLYNMLGTVSYGVTQVVFNLYLLKLNLREDDIGAFSAVQTIFMACSGLTLGFLLNRYGSWRCTSTGFALLVAASISIAFAETRPALFALSAAYGVGLAILFNTTMPFILEWSEARTRAHVSAVSFSLISLSLTIGSLVGGLLPDLLGSAVGAIEPGSLEAYRWTLVAGGVITGAGLIPLGLMAEARRRRAAPGSATVAEPTTSAGRRRVRSDIAMFVLIGGVMSLGVGMVLPFYNVFLVSLGASTHQIGYIFAAGGATAAVIGLAAPAFSRRVGSLRAVPLLRVLIAPLYLLLIFFPGYGLGILAHMVRQTTVSMAWPIESTFIGEILPARARATVFGLRSSSWNFGYSAAAFIGGKIIVRTGYNWSFVSIGLFTTLSAVIYLVYYGRHPLVSGGEVPSALPQRRGDRARLNPRSVAGISVEPEPQPSIVA